MGHNSAPLKDNCALFAPTAYFWPRVIRWCYLNFSPIDLCCHGNKIWDKTDYNSVCVKDICNIFASIGGFGGWVIECCQPNFPRATLISMATKFGTWRIAAYVRGISKIFASDGGVFEVGLLWYGQCACAIILKRTYAPRKNHTFNIRKIVIIYQQKHFYIF